MPDEIAGPRKILYFFYLLLGAVLLYVLGAVMSQVYGFTLLEDLLKPIVDNPMVLFDLAGVFAIIAGLVIVYSYVGQHLE